MVQTRAAPQLLTWARQGTQHRTLCKHLECEQTFAPSTELQLNLPEDHRNTQSDSPAQGKLLHPLYLSFKPAASFLPLLGRAASFMPLLALSFHTLITSGKDL